MKKLLFLSLFIVSTAAYSESTDSLKTSGQHAQTERQDRGEIQEEESFLGVPKGIQTDHQQELREEQSNDDFDPEVDGIDGEYTPKEGIHDE